jgi:hypothetical protein
VDFFFFFFSLPNPSSRTMALSSTQPLPELSTWCLPGGEGRPTCKADSLTATCEPTVYKIWASTACKGDSFKFLLPPILTEQNRVRLPSQKSGVLMEPNCLRPFPARVDLEDFDCDSVDLKN